MIYVFGNYTLDTDLYILHRSGEPVKLEHQVFKVLTYLIEHRDYVVAKQELFEHLWPDRFVSDKALERCIQMARRALGDQSEAPRFIQTLRGRGYRFIGDIQRGSSSSQHPAEPPADHVAPALHPVPALLDHQGQPPVVPALSLPAPGGEHKPVTVLVCALTEATVLASQLGPEVMFNLMQGLFVLAQSEVQRYEGTIIQYRGGGFIALFGAPLAHEDHALRAVLVALALQRRFREEAVTLGLPSGEGLGLRVGLHTGPVVVGSLGDDAQMTYTAVGDTTQLADCLLQHAEPGTILASDATVQLVQGDVRLEDRGLVYNPGKTDAVLAYRIVSHQPRRSPWLSRRERPLSRFVGRTRELAFLHERLTQAKNGQGQVVGLVGEPGLGKSRLLYEFRQGLQEQQVTYLEGRCLSYGRTVPYLPLLDLLRQNCTITDADHTEAVAEKVRQSLQEVEMEPETWAPYLLVHDHRG